MQHKLTITVGEDVYRALHHKIGRGSISRFIENLVRPHVLPQTSLEAEYRRAAREQAAEKDAHEWIEAGVGEDLD
ncbi:MAG: hypothetical protein ACR2FO_02230 [Actinomycetota bacterium]